MDHTSIFGVSHIDLPVRDVARARAFYVDGFGFTAGPAGEGWADVQTGSVLLRLVHTSNPELRSAFRVHCGDVAQTWRGLVALGARPLYEPQRMPSLELAGSLLDPDGNTITVWRPLSEDEYGFVPELPVAGAWAAGSEDLLKSLLLSVPSLFRGLARRKVVRLAEEIAAGRAVEKLDVVRAYILSNARITRYRVKEPLRKHGYDPDQFAAEFAAE